MDQDRLLWCASITHNPLSIAGKCLQAIATIERPSDIPATCEQNSCCRERVQTERNQKQEAASGEDLQWLEHMVIGNYG